MKKTAWPWLGSTDKEMGNANPRGFKHLNIDTNEYHPYGIDSPIPNEHSSEGSLFQMNFSDDFTEAEPSEKCTVCVSEDDGTLVAEFNCGIAKNINEKIAGLQIYKNLEKNAGLIFEYKKPEDVTYHMGSVSFPIDIIFIDEKNSIKRIAKNISPGSLDMFSCSSVKFVLEICGGLSDELGISVGHRVVPQETNKKLSSSVFGKDIILKYSGDRSSMWNNKFPIISPDSSIMKFASETTSPEEVGIIYIDEYLAHSKIFASLIDDLGPMRRTADGAIGIKLDVLNKPFGRFVKFSDLNSIQNHEAITISRDTFSKFLPRNILEEIISVPANDTYILTQHNPSVIKSLINASILSIYGLENKIACDNFIKVNGNVSDVNVVYYFSNKYPNSDLKIVSHKNITKNAGSPVPNETKEKAKHARLYFERCLEMVEKSLENVLKNKSEYEKIQGDEEKIKNSKKDFEQSEHRNKSILKRMLIQIRSGIQILDEIKDASSTLEIIDYLASSSKNSSDILHEIFDLKNVIETPDFYPRLIELSNNYEKSIEDLSENLSRAKDYINNNILGLIIIAD